MASGRSVPIPRLGRAISPSNSVFQSVSSGKPKWSGGRFRLSHKDRTDALGIPSLFT